MLVYRRGPRCTNRYSVKIYEAYMHGDLVVSHESEKTWLPQVHHVCVCMYVRVRSDRNTVPTHLSTPTVAPPLTHPPAHPPIHPPTSPLTLYSIPFHSTIPACAFIIKPCVLAIGSNQKCGKFARVYDAHYLTPTQKKAWLPAKHLHRHRIRQQ